MNYISWANIWQESRDAIFETLRSLYVDREKLFGPVGVTTRQTSVFLALRTRDADASFGRRAWARNRTSAVVKMAEAPIGQ